MGVCFCHEVIPDLADQDVILAFVYNFFAFPSSPRHNTGINYRTISFRASSNEKMNWILLN